MTTKINQTKPNINIKNWKPNQTKPNIHPKFQNQTKHFKTKPNIMFGLVCFILCIKHAVFSHIVPSLYSIQHQLQQTRIARGGNCKRVVYNHWHPNQVASLALCTVWYSMVHRSKSWLPPLGFGDPPVCGSNDLCDV